MSVNGNTTVVDEGSSDGDYVKPKVVETTGISASSGSKIRAHDLHPGADPFMKVDDRDAVEREFFVKIERDGVLPALIKLDSQLQAVSYSSSLNRHNSDFYACSRDATAFCQRRHAFPP